MFCFQTGAKVSISDSSGVERIASVVGSSSQIVKALSMICDKFEEVTVILTCLIREC